MINSITIFNIWLLYVDHKLVFYVILIAHESNESNVSMNESHESNVR